MVDVITYNSNKCIICQQDDKEGTSSCNLVRVSEKGLDTTLDYFISNEDQIKAGSVFADLLHSPMWKFLCMVYVDKISQTRFVLMETSIFV